MRWKSTLVLMAVLVGAASTAARTLPGTPANVTATIANDVLDVSWTAPPTGDPALAYAVHIDGPGLPIGGVTIPSTTTAVSLPMTGLPFGRFVVSVLALNADGQGRGSAPLDVTYGGVAMVPSAPRNLAVTYANGVLAVTWDPPTVGAPIASYRLEVGVSGGLAAAIPLTSTSFSTPVGVLAPGTYSFQVIAVNSAGQGPPSAAVTLQIGAATVPSAPLNLAVHFTPGLLRVTWDPPASGAPITTYNLRVGGVTGGAMSVTGTSFSSPIAALPPGTLTFSVSAVNAVGEGPPATASLTTGPPAVPSVPLNLTAVYAGGRLTVSWDPPLTGRPITHYLLRAQTPAGGSPFAAPYPTTATSFSVPVPSGLPPGNYSFAVSAVNALGEGPTTSTTTLTIVAALPSAPLNATASVIAGNLMVAWDPPAVGAPDTYVLRGTGPFNGVWTRRDPGTVFVAPVASLAPGLYAFTVSAENTLGEGPAAGPATVTIGPPCPVPAAPMLTGSVSGGIATLSWTTPPGTAVTGYTLQIAVGSGGATQSADVGGLSTISGPVAPGTYGIRVTARSACGPGPASNAVTLTVP